jgi:hypothetical protein
MAKSNPRSAAAETSFNLVIVAHAGRLQYEAVLFAASFHKTNPDFQGRFFVAVPEAGPKWPSDPMIDDPRIIDLLEGFGAEIIRFPSVHFGADYPYGNKIEALMALPKGKPFVFFDTDTLILDNLSTVPFDFNRPGASERVEGTWPVMELYGPGYTEIWKSLYDRFDLDFDSSLDMDQPDEYWRRYLYFNAGYFFGPCPHEFGALFAEYATSIRNDPPATLVCQPLNPWLDQIVLPLVIHALGGGRGALPEGMLDGSVSCHYRFMALLFARESDAVIDFLHDITTPHPVKRVLKDYDPMKRFIFQNKGNKARGLFDQDDLPAKEIRIRKRLKNHNLWVR